MAAIPTSTPDLKADDSPLAGSSIPEMSRKRPPAPPRQYMDDEKSQLIKQLTPTPENKQASEVPMSVAQQAYLDGYLAKQAGPVDAVGKAMAGAPAKATGRSVAPVPAVPVNTASTDTAVVAPVAAKAPTTRGNTAMQDARQANVGLAAKKKMMEEVE